MCLLLAIFVLLGPRALIFFWWLLEPARWQLTFQSAFVPIIGLLFLPWTTIMYVLFWTIGGLDFVGWLFVALAFVLDIGTWGGGAFGNRERFPSYNQE